jgi:hypothetical protein
LSTRVIGPLPRFAAGRKSKRNTFSRRYDRSHNHLRYLLRHVD